MKKDDYTYIEKIVSNAKRPTGSVDRRFLDYFKEMKKVKLSIDDSRAWSIKKLVEDKFEASKSRTSASYMEQEQLSQKGSTQNQSKTDFQGTNHDIENEDSRDKKVVSMSDDNKYFYPHDTLLLQATTRPNHIITSSKFSKKTQVKNNPNEKQRKFKK